MNDRGALARMVPELAVVLVLSAAIGYYLLAQIGQGPGVAVPTSAQILAAFYYPMSFPVDALVRALALDKPAASNLTVFATIVIQNVLLWLLGRWLARVAKK